MADNKNKLCMDDIPYSDHRKGDPNSIVELNIQNG